MDDTTFRCNNCGRDMHGSETTILDNGKRSCLSCYNITTIFQRIRKIEERIDGDNPENSKYHCKPTQQVNYKEKWRDISTFWKDRYFQAEKHIGELETGIENLFKLCSTDEEEVSDYEDRSYDNFSETH